MGNEKFCPECGQANKGNKITFSSFIYGVFNGLFNFEAKFWTTIIPLLIKPGKVSKDYIEGKRQRYSNPFQFYLTVSIVFFLILGLTKTIDKYNELAKGSETETLSVLKKKPTNKLSKQKIDSMKTALDHKMKNFVIPVPENARKKVLNEIEKEIKDTINKKGNKFKGDGFKISFGNGSSKIDKIVAYINKHPKTKIDAALDSLKYEKNFTNRFLFTRAKAIYSFTKSKETREEKLNQLFSYGSIALFVLLPIFTLSLKLFYIRRKYTYVEHLIFVFHIQTVFFMLFSIYFLLLIFKLKPLVWLFLVLFLLYLFLALKKFYQQGYFKTFIKFILLNISYGIVASIGAALIISAALMFL